MRGCVYVMRSAHLPGWAKVGYTTRDPEQRATELSTGLPGRLEVYAECECDDARTAEREVHHLLRRYRHSSRDEWFKIDAVQATKLIRETFGLEALERKRRQKHAMGWIGLVILVLLTTLLPVVWRMAL